MFKNDFFTKDRYLIYIRKNIKGFVGRVLVGSFKNKYIAELSLKKMIKCGMKAELICPKLPKPVGRPRNWENIP